MEKFKSWLAIVAGLAGIGSFIINFDKEYIFVMSIQRRIYHPSIVCPTFIDDKDKIIPGCE
jgi:hypothetical protein